jgi:hypothetical protein
MSPPKAWGPFSQFSCELVEMLACNHKILSLLSKPVYANLQELTISEKAAL